jgi:hypothetical protein
MVNPGGECEDPERVRADPYWVQECQEGFLWRQAGGRGSQEGEEKAVGPRVGERVTNPENLGKFLDLMSQDPDWVWGGLENQPEREEEGVGVWSLPADPT